MIFWYVVAAALALAVVVVALSASRHTALEPLDTDRQERWLIRHAPARFRGVLRFADRRVVGGATVAVALATVLACGLLIGWLLDGIDNHRGFARWDASAARWGAEHISDPSVLKRITDLGASVVIVPLLLGVAVVDMLVRRRKRIDVLLYVAAIGLGILALNNLLKLLVHRERPNIARLVHVTGYSFPSGHTATAAAAWMAAALVLTRGRPRAARITATFVAALIAGAVATSRVLLGVHWLTDVIGGVLIGWTWFFLVTLAFGGRLMRLGEPAERARATPPAAQPEQRVRATG